MIEGLAGYENMKEPELLRGLIETAGKRLSKMLENQVSIELVDKVDDETLEAMVEIDKMFSPDMRYSREEYMECLEFEDASLIVVSADGKPAGFHMGYYDDDFDEWTYYIDVLAVKDGFQSRGIGKTLLRLGFVVAHQLGYTESVLFCDKSNGSGVNMPRYYQRKAGFYQYAPEDDFGIPLCKDLTPESVAEAIAKIRGDDAKT